MELIKDNLFKQDIVGTFSTYSKIYCPNGYVFYDKTLGEDEEIVYHNQMYTSIRSNEILSGMFEVIKEDDIKNQEIS